MFHIIDLQCQEKRDGVKNTFPVSLTLTVILRLGISAKQIKIFGEIKRDKSFIILSTALLF